MTISSRAVGLLLAFMLCHSSSAVDSGVQPGVSLELAERRAALLSDVRYRLHFDIPADVASPIRARGEISFDLRDSAGGLQLDFRERGDRIQALRVNGSSSPYRVEREHIVLPADSLVEGRNRVEIAFTAGDSSLNRYPDYLHTLFVPDRARTAFPLFDQPDLKAVWELTLAVPREWVAVANAPLEERITGGERVEYRFAPTQPLSSYLFAFAAGRFQTVTRSVDGRAMTLYHRETDGARLERNLDAIFDAHGDALAWLEDYTGVDYPFPKFDFVLIPTFPYGGMEHPGAVFYRAANLLLEERPPPTRLLERAQLIAHETAHMWFGNLVTMRWFDDVWTKEVFAGFMADRIVNHRFPDIDHELAFLLGHHPGAYAVDRTAGANPIRQPLANLDQAGQLYGGAIYDKAPIMMRQLELLTGADRFRAGLRDYLSRFAFGNATWPELVAILDRGTDLDLAAWSRVWVETAGRPIFEIAAEDEAGKTLYWLQHRDPAGAGRVWPQRFTLLPTPPGDYPPVVLEADRRRIPLPAPGADGSPPLLNADGRGYGSFPVHPELFDAWSRLPAVSRGALMVDGWENLVEGALGDPLDYLRVLVRIVGQERDPLLLREALWQLSRVYLTLIDERRRAAWTELLEQSLWRGATGQADSRLQRLFFEAFAELASSREALLRLYRLWSQEETLPGVALEEDDFIELAEVLAIGLPERADGIVAAQLKRIENPDNGRRLAFLAPSLSPDAAVRDAFFDSLAKERQRETESWVVDALSRLHHPSRLAQSEKYIEPALALLEEIQATGDIFFPSRWLAATLRNHASPGAAATVHDFLAARPGYNPQLRMKILQEADPLFRASRLRTRYPD